MIDNTVWIKIRAALLLMVAAIEDYLDIRPKTAELRKKRKEDAE